MASEDVADELFPDTAPPEAFEVAAPELVLSDEPPVVV